MLLISHFWHALLLAILLTLAFPQTRAEDPEHHCWLFEDTRPFTHAPNCQSPSPPEGFICGLDKQSGFGVGCVSQADSPKINQQNKLVCGPEKYCCCKGNLCSYDVLNNYFKEREKICQEVPELSNSELCIEPGVAIPLSTYVVQGEGLMDKICNRVSPEACKIMELAELGQCRTTTTKATKTTKYPEKGPIQENSSGKIWNAGFLLLVVEL